VRVADTKLEEDLPASEAVAATMMVYFMASFSSRVLTSWATVERFWPTAT
jgi:hypothetical protein